MSSQDHHGARRQGDCAPAVFRLGGLEAEAGRGFLEGALDPERSAIEIEIAELECQQLSAAHARCQCCGADCAEWMALELTQNHDDLMGVQDLNLTGVDFGRRNHTGHVAHQSFVFDGPLKRSMQDAVGVTDSASRQCSATLAPTLDESAMPGLHLGRLELLEYDGAEVRDDLLFGQPSVSLDGLEGQPVRAVESIPQILGNGHLGRLRQRARICRSQEASELAFGVLALALTVT
jgi:hypothetical protein